MFNVPSLRENFAKETYLENLKHTMAACFHAAENYNLVNYKPMTWQ